MNRLLILSLLIVSLILSGCKAIAIGRDMQQAIGITPEVSTHWSNGVVSVTLTFDSLPTSTTNLEIAQIADRIIQANFEEEPETIILSYQISRNNPSEENQD